MTFSFPPRRRLNRQSGSATVEFALIALFAFLPLTLAIIEIGRLYFVTSTVQEVTRRAARQQVVSWISQSNAVQRNALFQSATGSGTVSLPGGHEVTNGDVRLSFYNTYADALSGSNGLSGGTAASNFESCLRGDPCIRYVRASLESSNGGPVNYSPMVGWFGQLFGLPLPGATVIMPAEGLGLL